MLKLKVGGVEGLAGLGSLEGLGSHYSKPTKPSKPSKPQKKTLEMYGENTGIVSRKKGIGLRIDKLGVLLAQ